MKKKSVVFGVSAAMASLAFWACGSGEVITFDENLEGVANFTMDNISDADVSMAIANCLADSLGCAIEMRNAGPLPTDFGTASSSSSSQTQNPGSSASIPWSSIAPQSSMFFTPQTSSSSWSFGGHHGNSAEVQSSSSVYVGPGSEYGSCAPEKNPINHGEGTTWKFTKVATLDGQIVINADYAWSFDGGASPATSAAHAKSNTETITYATSGVKNATLTFTPRGGSPVAIQCAPLQVNGAAISGCRCNAAATSVDVALGQSPSWSVSGCMSQGATITGYTWGGTGVTGSGTTAVGTVAAKGDVAQATVVVENNDNTKVTVTCPAVKAVDSNDPDYIIDGSATGTFSNIGPGEYSMVYACQTSAFHQTPLIISGPTGAVSGTVNGKRFSVTANGRASVFSSTKRENITVVITSGRAKIQCE